MQTRYRSKGRLDRRGIIMLRPNRVFSSCSTSDGHPSLPSSPSFGPEQQQHAQQQPPSVSSWPPSGSLCSPPLPAGAHGSDCLWNMYLAIWPLNSHLCCSPGMWYVTDFSLLLTWPRSSSLRNFIKLLGATAIGRSMLTYSRASASKFYVEDRKQCSRRLIRLAPYP